MVSLNPCSRSLSFSPFPRAVGKFLSVDHHYFCIQVLDLIAFSDHNSWAFEWKTSGLNSVPRFHIGSCCSSPFVRNPSQFHIIGNCWWQLQVSICSESVCSPHTLRYAGFNPFPSPKLHGIWWWLLAELDWVQLENWTESDLRTGLGLGWNWVWFGLY